jgi:tetratricopeptide (TPR) repeat protein
MQRFAAILFFVVLIPFVKIHAQDDTTNIPMSPDEQLAVQYYQSGDYDKAAVYYEKLYNKNPISLYYNYYLNCLIFTKNFKKAEKTVKKQQAKNDWDLRYKIDLGRVYRANGEEDKAKKEFKGAVDAITGITSPRHVIEVSDAFLAINETDYAVDALKKGRKELSLQYTFNIELAEVYAMKKDYQNMVVEYLDLLEISDGYKKQVQDLLQPQLDADLDNKISTILRTELIKRSQKQPDKTIWNDMLMWYYMQENNFAMALIQAKAVDKRDNLEGWRIMDLAETARSNRQYSVATDAYDYVISLGPLKDNYNRAKIEKVNTRYQEVTSRPDYTSADLLSVEEEMIATLDELGKNSATLSLMVQLAHLQAFYLHKTKAAIILLEEAIVLPGVNAGRLAWAKLELGDVLLLDGQVWEASLRYSQVEKAFKTEPVGHEAKLKNAKVAFYIGDFHWAQTQLAILKEAPQRPIANDAIYLSMLITDNLALDSNPAPLMLFAKADLMLFQNNYAKAIVYLDSIESEYPTHGLADDILYMRYKIAFKQQNYKLAATFLQQIIDNHSFDILGDDATYRMAELYDYYLNDKEKAKQYYLDVITNFPGSLFKVDAQKRYRQLRGDNVQE